MNKKYRNAVVRIEFTPVTNWIETRLNPSKNEVYSGRRFRGGHGTGFFISEDEILTNAHVVADARRGSLKMRSPASGSVEFKLEIVGVSTNGVDIAILKLPEDEKMRFKKRSGLKNIPFLKLGDSSNVKQSDPLAIMGYPSASDELKVIEAEVTGRHYPGYRAKHQFIEVGPGGVVQPGNSGGPALSKDGFVVGIPTLGNYRGSSGWLTPSNVIMFFLQKVRENDKGNIPLEIPELGLVFTRNFSGTSVLAGSPDDVTIFELGVVVREVLPSGQGESWGVKRGDIVIGFANKQKNLSAALDFEGFRVVTGLMSTWPAGNKNGRNEGKTKIHLKEMVFLSDEGDDVSVWLIRPHDGQKAGQASPIMRIDRKIHIDHSDDLPHLGLYEKPDYALWADFVVQEFNDFNKEYFNIPLEEVQKGGILITYVEANSLASRRGIDICGDRYNSDGLWYIIDEINGASVRTLIEFRKAILFAEMTFQEKLANENYDPQRRTLLKERYIRIKGRTNSDKKIITLTTAFPIDEATECSNIKRTPNAPQVLPDVKKEDPEPTLAKRNESKINNTSSVSP